MKRKAIAAIAATLVFCQSVVAPILRVLVLAKEGWPKLAFVLAIIELAVAAFLIFGLNRLILLKPPRRTVHKDKWDSLGHNGNALKGFISTLPPIEKLLFIISFALFAGYLYYQQMLVLRQLLSSIPHLVAGLVWMQIVVLTFTMALLPNKGDLHDEQVRKQT